MKNCEPLVSGPAFAIDKNPVDTENDKKKKKISPITDSFELL
jgi:hypothetical protein